MTQQETGGTGEPTLSESVEAEQETSDTEVPALNRAERRAQAKNKKAGAGPNPAAPHANNARGPAGRPSGHAGPVRFPRTGHK